MFIDHVRIVYEIISDMAVYYSTWSENKGGDKKALNKKKGKMQLLEEEGDELKIRIIQDYAELGAGLGKYIDLILRLDNIINYPLEFIDMLDKINVPKDQMGEISKRYHKLINKIMKMCDVLKTTIKNLRDNEELVFNNTTEIHEIENEIDSTYRQFLDFLYSNEKIDIRLLLRIRDSIVLLEQLADRIHDVADLIRVLIYE